MNHAASLSALLLLAATMAPAVCAGATSPDPCHDAAPHLVVSASEHRLWSCDQGRVVNTYGVRLGRGGAGKRREGDKKVPVGRYQLGAPRSSEKFGLFIPVEYPTPAQRKAGYTGGSVGVHGPHRAVAWLGRLVNLFDTTDGCIGIATDKEMKALADWARTHHARYIEVVPSLPAAPRAVPRSRPRDPAGTPPH